MGYCSYEIFSLILSRFFIGYWILKRGWISILAPFFCHELHGEGHELHE